MARAIFHGRRGEVLQRDREGQEDQLGALGLVVNLVVLWNTSYMDEALAHLRRRDVEANPEDVARLSPWEDAWASALAELVGVSQPTLVALEKQGGGGRLDTLERVLETLGAGAYLATDGQAKAFFTHAGNASVSDEWETPQVLLDSLHAVFGRFDLDPCAPRRSRGRG